MKWRGRAPEATTRLSLDGLYTTTPPTRAGALRRDDVRPRRLLAHRRADMRIIDRWQRPQWLDAFLRRLAYFDGGVVVLIDVKLHTRVVSDDIQLATQFANGIPGEPEVRTRHLVPHMREKPHHQQRRDDRHKQVFGAHLVGEERPRLREAILGPCLVSHGLDGLNEECASYDPHPTADVSPICPAQREDRRRP